MSVWRREIVAQIDNNLDEISNSIKKLSDPELETLREKIQGILEGME